MSSKIKVDTIENVAGSGNVSLGSGHNLVVPGTLGVGETTPLGKFHVKSGDSAASSVNANANELVVENSDYTGITILGENESNIMFGDNEDPDIGRIEYHHSDDSMRFRTGATDKMIITTAGLIGIGHNSPSAKLDIRGTGYVGLGVGSTNASGAAIFLDGDSNGDFSGSDYSYIVHDTAGRLDIIQDSPSGTNQIRLFTEGTTERMRVSSNILIGTTNNSPGEGTSAGIRLGTNGASQFSAGNQCLDLNRTANNGDVVVFRRGGTVCGEIVVNGDNQTTAYQTSSDYRLKENVTYDFDATARLKQLKPARFNFISNPNDTTVDGFLAHEVSAIVPEAVGGEKDATKILSNVVLNSDGTVNSSEIDEKDWIAGKEDKIYASNTTWVVSKTVPSYQGIDQSKLVPLLVKTIQELEARIAVLETK